jgi:hypothetical protein
MTFYLVEPISSSLKMQGEKFAIKAVGQDTPDTPILVVVSGTIENLDGTIDNIAVVTASMGTRVEWQLDRTGCWRIASYYAPTTWMNIPGGGPF